MEDFRLIKGRFTVMDQLHITVENIEHSGLTEKELTDLLNSVDHIFNDLKYFDADNKEFHCTSMEIDRQRVLYITSGKLGLKLFIVDEGRNIIDLTLTVRSLKILLTNENKMVDYLINNRACPFLGQNIEDVHKLTNDLYENIDSRGPPEYVNFHGEDFEVDFDPGDV